MTDADRQHLARILGMLGSDHAGERAAAALQAEAFRRKHGLTWGNLLALPPVWTPQAEDLMRDAANRIAELEAEVQRWMRRPPREKIVEIPIYVERKVEKIVYVGLLDLVHRGVNCRQVDRGVAIVLGAIPLVMILNAIRAALGY
jgi:hypothetical protein